MPRPSKEEYYLNIAREVSRRATCFRVRIGAIIVRDDQIIATGYVGAPRKTKDCFEHGFCLRNKLGIPHGQRYELCRSVHAEMNALINAARAGVSLLNGDIYIYGERLPENYQVGNEIKGIVFDCFPCFICKKQIINAGLSRVICSKTNGGLQIFNVSDWISDWQKKDIIDDQHQYGDGINKK